MMPYVDGVVSDIPGGAKCAEFATLNMSTRNCEVSRSPNPVDFTSDASTLDIPGLRTSAVVRRSVPYVYAGGVVNARSVEPLCNPLSIAPLSGDLRADIGHPIRSCRTPARRHCKFQGKSALLDPYRVKRPSADKLICNPRVIQKLPPGAKWKCSAPAHDQILRHIHNQRRLRAVWRRRGEYNL